MIERTDVQRAKRAAYMRAWRLKNGRPDLATPLARKKHSARSYANSYQRRGLVVMAERCERCNAKDVPLEKHHRDYDKLLEFETLCRRCHKIADAKMRSRMNRKRAA